MNIVLTKDKTETQPFAFLGDCYICAKGQGQISILRDMGGEFVVMTNSAGEELAYLGDGVIFNGSITCKSRIKHKIVAHTESSITISIVTER